MAFNANIKIFELLTKFMFRKVYLFAYADTNTGTIPNLNFLKLIFNQLLIVNIILLVFQNYLSLRLNALFKDNYLVLIEMGHLKYIEV